MSLCFGSLCKSHCGRRGRPVGPEATNKSRGSLYCLANYQLEGIQSLHRGWWSVERDGEDMRQKAKDERDREVMRGGSTMEEKRNKMKAREKVMGGRER